MKEKKDIAEIIIRQISDCEDFGSPFECGDGYRVWVDFAPVDWRDRDNVMGIFAHVFSPDSVVKYNIEEKPFEFPKEISIEEELFEYPEDDDSKDLTEFADKYFRRDSDYFYDFCYVVDMLVDDILAAIEEDKKWQ